MKILTKAFMAENHGPTAIARLLREIEAGTRKTGTVVLQAHPVYLGSTEGRELGRITFARATFRDDDRGPAWRYCDKDGDPMGEGTSSFIASWDRDQSVAAAAAVLSYELARQVEELGRRNGNAIVMVFVPEGDQA